MDRLNIVKAAAKDLNINVIENNNPTGGLNDGAFFFYKGHRFISVRDNISREKKADIIWKGLTMYFPLFPLQ